MEQCLGIPLPKCMRDLTKAPLVITCQPAEEEEAVNMLRHLSEGNDIKRRFSIDELEIKLACNLAAGPGDIAILLHCPSPQHRYEQPLTSL